jgi:hypothetical protein
MTILADAVTGSRQIERDDVEVIGPLLDPRYTDDGAVQLTIQDAQRAKTYLDLKQWNLHWREADILYQAPRTMASFEGSTVARANVSRFTVATHVNSLVPGMVSGIFYETPPFVIRPRPNASQNTARAKSALYGTLMDDCSFQAEAELAMEDQVNFGTVICKAGWCKETKVERVRRPKGEPITVDMPFTGEDTIYTVESDELETIEVEVTTEGMFFEKKELGNIFVDPTWRKPNNLHKGAKFVIEVSYPTFNDLDRLREEVVYDADGNVVGGYDIPSEEELKDYFFTHPEDAGFASQVQQNLGDQNWTLHHAQNENTAASADPLERPIKMLERWDHTYVYAVLVPDGSDRGVLIRKEEHGLPFLPYFAANFWNIPNAGYGLGVGRLAGNDQRIDKGLTDAMLDILSFACNPQYMRDIGANVPTQQIRQRLGGILDVQSGPRGIREAFALVEQPRVPAEVFPILADSRQSANNATGASEPFTQGNVPQKGSTALRTATGAGGVMAANAGRIQGPVGHFVNGILLPFIELMDFLVKDRMSVGKIREILGDKLRAAFKLDIRNFYESKDQFEVLAGARLAAKKAMAQALPLMVQIFENQPLVQQLNAIGYMVDVKELFAMFMEVTEWKNSRELIRPMTPQELQRYGQNNPGLQRVQGQIAGIQARHQAKSAEIDQKAEADLAKEMLGRANDEAAGWDERRWDRQAINESEFAPTGG